VLDHAEDAIGNVDAVIIATDIGREHVTRCRPFVEAGIPVFVDKPLVDRIEDLAIFTKWIAEGKPILSGSCMAYAKEFAPYRESTHELGALRFASTTTHKSWERYGIHALSAVFPIFGPGFISARNTGTTERNIVHLKHQNGADIVVAAVHDMNGGFGALQLCGTAGCAQVMFRDTFYAFKAQLAEFVNYVQSGKPAFPFAHTEELMQMLIAGIWSREQNGREVLLDEIARAMRP
ncbi:MAG: oxidoreductase, partial [Candidatus Hydrogenedentes bacterium]|nr:oxidoreductase [Candidatus Hydrogenedentota bacterium]